MRKTLTAILLGIIIPISTWAHVSFYSKKDITVAVSNDEEQVVRTALGIFSSDYAKVFNAAVKTGSKQATIYIGTIGLQSKAESLVDKQEVEEAKRHAECFFITVRKGNLIVLGSDKRGTAYGILELSRLIGVSPWEWWADANPAKQVSYTFEEGFRRMEYPSVANRGIFLNDEDWGLMPWSYLTNEPSPRKGEIGPKTHARIFELLLRLRANTFWPAMHDCSIAFYLTPGNKEMADKYGIFVGTSHCEPMMRNTNAEWKTAGKGTYDYVHNRESVLDFWRERVIELAGSDNIYTLGIRGVHDSKMLGANTLQEQKDAITNVLKDQREMLAKYVNPDMKKVSQVFIPYKEVLDVYNMGLEVPEDVTLMWCDDNYGYIRHFPNAKERARKGGNGVYYHVSYWGRPHDYLWLSTNHPAQLYTQMKMSYDKGAKDMWILNVGDIKPAEYLIELAMDMAWNINAIENNRDGLDKHLHTWLSREFGTQNAGQLLPVMNEYYRLAYIRKPEYMGNTRTEEQDPKYKIVSDLPWSETYIRERISQYETISNKVVAMSSTIAPEKQSCWFELVEYPVRGAAEMNRKHLYGQLARHGKADWQQSDAAFDTIVELTGKYNSLENGKWNKMMDFQPRKLPVFDRVPHTTVETPLVEDKVPLFLFNGNEYTSFAGERPVCYGLGYERGAVSVLPHSSVKYSFANTNTDSVQVEVALAPNHPVEGTKIRYAISINNAPEQVVEYQTEGRSEEWKLNTLRNQAIRTTTHPVRPNEKVTIRITAVDEGIAIDQIKVW